MGNAQTESLQIDAKDREILRILVEDSSTSKAEIARSVALTPTAVFERLRKLEERGIIRGYTVSLDPLAFNLSLVAFVSVSEIKPAKRGSTGNKLAKIKQVEEVHRVTGKDCFLVKVRTENTATLTKILDEMAKLDSVGAVQTMIVLESFLDDERTTRLDQIKGS